MSWRAWLNNRTSRVNLKDTLIAFDTSALLNLYSFPVATTDRYIEILQLLRKAPALVEANVSIAIPPQVVFEFVTTSISVKRNATESYSAVITKLKGIKSLLAGEPDYVVGALRETWQQQSEELITPIVETLQKQRDAIRSRNEKDPILKFLSPLFDEAERFAPTTEERAWLAQHGPDRYKFLVPPGYEDKSKLSGGEDNPQNYYVYGPDNRILRMYGDLLIWRQLLSHAHSLAANTPIERIFFVTDDEKPDWFWSHGDTKRQHPLLTVEAQSSGFKLNVINSAQFLELSAKALEVTVESSDFEAVRRVLKGRESALEYEKEVEVLSEGLEEGLIAIHLKRPVPIATATLPFETEFAEKPRLIVTYEAGPTSRLKCFGGLGASRGFNVHVNAAAPGELLPEGEYLVRYRAEAIDGSTSGTQ